MDFCFFLVYRSNTIYIDRSDKVTVHGWMVCYRPIDFVWMLNTLAMCPSFCCPFNWISVASNRTCRWKIRRMQDYTTVDGSICGQLFSELDQSKRKEKWRRKKNKKWLKFTFNSHRKMNIVQTDFVVWIIEY